jgi:pimeloyl-ACP methyl ester carboxylesterase
MSSRSKLGWRLAFVIACSLSFVAGFLLREHESLLVALVQRTDNAAALAWPEIFAEVEIDGAGGPQRAWFFAAEGAVARPLLVSLHTWSGDYTQYDPLAERAAREGWNYIHPDFGGRNNTTSSCLSDTAVAGIGDAIDYAVRHGQVNLDRVFVSGMSGGGYAALGLYLRSRHKIHTLLSWVPISDLDAWYWQTVAKGLPYAEDIANCTGGAGVYSATAAKARSPLHWSIVEPPAARLEIYAGIHDGHDGSVPISHSILFFNRMAELSGHHDRMVSPETTAGLLTRGLGSETRPGRSIDGREVMFAREAGSVSLTIFDGGHEMLPGHVIARVLELIEE